MEEKWKLNYNVHNINEVIIQIQKYFIFSKEQMSKLFLEEK